MHRASWDCSLARGQSVQYKPTSHSTAKDGDEQSTGEQSTPWVAGDTGISFGDREVLPGKDLGVPGAKLERDSKKGGPGMMGPSSIYLETTPGNPPGFLLK